MPNLLKLRKQIDRVDDQIVLLLNHRIRVARKIGDLKARNGDKVFDPRRQKQLLKRLCANQAGPLKDSELLQIYTCLMRISRQHQKRVFDAAKETSPKRKA